MNIWITLLTGAHKANLCGRLIDQGYCVSALEESIIVKEGPVSALLAFEVTASFEEEENPARAALEDVKEILTDLGAMWHSIVVVELDGWLACEGPNVRLPGMEPETVIETPPAGEDPCA